MNWIDTAAAYGFGHSEQVVGRALAGLAMRAPVRVHEGVDSPGAGRTTSSTTCERDSILREAEGQP